MNNLPEIQTIQNVSDAFKQLSEEHKKVKAFLFGNYADLIAQSRSTLKYPCLMLEEPNIQFLDNGADFRRRVYECAMIVLVSMGKDLHKKLEFQEICAEIIEDMVARLEYESIAFQTFYYRMNTNTAELIEPLGADGVIGYRLEMSIERVSEVYFDENAWI